MTKFLGEEICKLYRKTYNVNVEIARFYNVYGPHATLDEKFGNVIGIWTSKAMKGESLPIVGDGMQTRDFIHIFDLVDVMVSRGDEEVSHRVRCNPLGRVPSPRVESCGRRGEVGCGLSEREASGAGDEVESAEDGDGEWRVELGGRRRVELRSCAVAEDG